MSLFLEHRLIHRRASDFGVTSKPTRVVTGTDPLSGKAITSTAAQANAAKQDINRANTLLSKDVTGQTYIGADGRDTRMDESGNMTLPGTLSKLTQSGPATTRSEAGQAALTKLLKTKNQSKDQFTSPNTKGRTSYNQVTGVTRSDNSPINTSKLNFATPEERRAAVDSRLEGRLGTMGIPKDIYDQVKGILSTGGQIAGEVDGKMQFRMPDGSLTTINNANGTVIKGAVDAVTGNIEGKVDEEITTEENAPPAPVTDAAGVGENAPGTQDTTGQDDPLTPQDESQIGMSETTSIITPEASGANAAFANLPPEAQFLVPFLQQFQDSMNKSLTENASLTKGLLGNVEKTYSGVESQLEEMKQGYLSTTEAMNTMLEDVRDQNSEYIAQTQKAENDRLAWDEYKVRSQLSKQKREDHDAMVAQIALAGGFGQDAGIRAVMESDAEYESKIQDLAIQFSYARTDLAAKFAGLYNENQNSYVTQTIGNMKELRSSLERIGMQSISNKVAKSQAEQSIITTAWNNQVGLRKELATQNLNVAGQMATMMTQKREEDRQVESDALGKIEYLLKNYPKESVADAIRELGKNVKSFSVETLLNNSTFEELEKAQKAISRSGGGGGGYVSSFLPPELQEPVKPSVTFNQFINNKMEAEEKSLNKSLTPEARAKIMFENSEKWEKEYNATYLAGPTAVAIGQATTDLTQQFGEQVVQAAQLVLDGTYTGTDPVGKAAKAMGVPAAQVATALTKLRQSGAVAETSILSPVHQKSRDTIISQIKSDPFYTVWTGAKSAVTRINEAIGNNGSADGVSDIMAINAFQNGIVDPGATVREGDVTLMQTARAWSQVVNLNNWIEKIRDGDKLPPEMRLKMLQLAAATRDAYGRDFQVETVPKVRTLIKQNGLPGTVLDDYIGQTAGVAPTVSPEVSSFVDTYYSQ